MKKLREIFRNGSGVGSFKDLFEMLVGIFEIVGVMAAVFSVVLVYDTLMEMRIERQYTYRPSLYVHDQNYIIQTSYYYGDNRGLPVCNAENLSGGAHIAMELTNIGVGAAKDVRITITREDCLKAIDAYNRTSPYTTMKYGDRDTDPHFADHIEYSNGETRILQYFDEEVFFPYILPNAEQKCEYPLPAVYYCLINAVRIELEESGFSETEGNGYIPDIPILIEYSDVQGTEYREQAFLSTSLSALHDGFEYTVSLKTVKE